MAQEYVLGIDMGTGGARAGIFDLKGKPLAFCDTPYALYTPKSGWAEQDPKEWWEAVCSATRAAVKKAGINPRAIVGMSVDTTCCTVLCVDKDINPLRPAILWMDMRAASQANRISKAKSDALKYNGFGNVSAEWMPSKALWLKENEPEHYFGAAHILECTDWLMYRLTGTLTGSINTMSTRWYYNSEEGGWPVAFYNEIGLPELIEKFPKEIKRLGEMAGTLTRRAAEDMGLVPGIAVGEGGADAFVGLIGLDVVEPGRVGLITGSSHLHLSLVEGSVHQKGMWGSYPDAVIPGLQMVEGGQTSTGSIVNWFKENYCKGLNEKEPDRSIYDILNREAAKLPVGAEGLVALDYFQGNRTPHVDSEVRGMFYGLSLKHKNEHLYRAIIESICYGTQQIIEGFRTAGVAVDGIYISGGATKSDFWLQTHADVCNVPFYVPEVSEAPCMGSAILGAVVAGVYPDIKTAAHNMTTMKKTVEPNAKRHEEYQFFYEKYTQVYGMMKDWMHDITRHIM